MLFGSYEVSVTLSSNVFVLCDDIFLYTCVFQSVFLTPHVTLYSDGISIDFPCNLSGMKTSKKHGLLINVSVIKPLQLQQMKLKFDKMTYISRGHSLGTPHSIDVVQLKDAPKT